jgi:DNA-binding CsgD family transcriptional regulator
MSKPDGHGKSQKSHEILTNARARIRIRPHRRSVANADHRAVRGLTEAERAVLTLLADGWRSVEIAPALRLTARGFGNVRSSLLAKLGPRSDPHAAAIGFRCGLLELGRGATGKGQARDRVAGAVGRFGGGAFYGSGHAPITGSFEQVPCRAGGANSNAGAYSATTAQLAD